MKWRRRMFYSALNLRPSLRPSSSPTTPASYVHLALGYYTVSLPAFAPSSPGAFWLRARSVKSQTAGATRSAVLVERCLAEGEERRGRAVKWAEVDDRAEEERRRKEREEEEEDERGLAGLGIIGWRPPAGGRVQVGTTPPVTSTASSSSRSNALPTPPSSPNVAFPSTTSSSSNSALPSAPAAPAATNTPLMGLSLLGNLDFLYAHASYPSLSLSKLTTGSRQRPGAILLFGYSFKGRTYLSLGWDEGGFEAGVVERLWEEMNELTERLLVG